jgi:hypothetical protein
MIKRADSNGEILMQSRGGGSPIVNNLETKLWFYFLARTYIDIGCEALHLGQVGIIGRDDTDKTHYAEILKKIRDYAKKNARRHYVLLDAHTPMRGFIKNGISLLDFNSFPLRIKEVVGKPMEGILEVGHSDGLYLKSLGATSPSGWKAESMPYLVEFDNFGVRRDPPLGTANVKDHFCWGYDDISWFAVQTEEYRNKWLRYAHDWIKKTDPNGHLQICVIRMISGPTAAKTLRSYFANTNSPACPVGFSQEETIKAIWNPKPKTTPDKLSAGTAKTNITPPNPRYAVHDSLYARSLILEAGDVRIAFVALDLGGYTNPALAERLKKQFNLEEVYFCPQHTHSSQTGEREWLEEKLTSVVNEAAKNMFTARIAGGHRTFPQLSFNRLIVREDGHARESWFADKHYRYINRERLPHGPVDPSVGVVRIENLKGSPKVLIMNYACHPDVAWNNFEISADYVGYATKYTEEAFDNKINCLFIQGDGGNQAPLFKDGGRTGLDDPRPSDYDLINRMGKLLSIETVKLAKELFPNPYDVPYIKVKTDSLHFTGRYDSSLDYNVHFSVISINNRYVIATFPDEPFIKFQIDWKKEMQPYATPFFFGYTWNGGKWPVYVPDIRSAALGGYGADWDPNLIELGAGERIMAKQLENYYWMNGLMRSQPGPNEHRLDGGIVIP